MTNPIEPGTIVHRAAVAGQLDPGTVYPLLPADFYNVQSLTGPALRTALGTRTRFYMVMRAGASDPVYRERWSLAVNLSGPSLRTNQATGHPTEVTADVLVYPFGSDHWDGQLTRDPDDQRQLPYQGQLCGLVAAQWLRHVWGPGARELVVGTRGTLTITPQSLRHSPMTETTPLTTVDYTAQGLAAYAFATDPGTDYQPGIWMVLSDPDNPGDVAAQWKLSYCLPTWTDNPADRWDDPLEPAPSFELLPG